MIQRSTIDPPAADSLPPEMEQRLMGVLEKYLEDIEQGFAPDAEQLLAEHPDLAEPLRAHLDSLNLLYQMGAEMSPLGKSASKSTGLCPKQLGDYSILREVGRGGMGVVYEARQVSLDRRVALKVLPFAAVLDQRQIERFKNEARAAEQLHHPNIVPVFDVGCQRGVHYYAMQYVEGQSLDAVIQQLRQASGPAHGPVSTRSTAGGTTAGEAGVPTRAAGKSTSLLQSFRTRQYARDVAGVGVQVAEALHCAHVYGIIHRDVKPSNLLLDGDGKVWVTDFGLARIQAESRVTMTGDVLGTLRYMSPEQAAGRPAAIDERTDVYSLGITLYELSDPSGGIRGVGPPRFTPPDRQ